jgi:hypothetical protein
LYSYSEYLIISAGENLSSFFLLSGYSGYTAMQYSLHSVQTQKGKKEWGCIFKITCFKAALVLMYSHPFSLAEGQI